MARYSKICSDPPRLSLSNKGSREWPRDSIHQGCWKTTKEPSRMIYVVVLMGSGLRSFILFIFIYYIFILILISSSFPSKILKTPSDWLHMSHKMSPPLWTLGSLRWWAMMPRRWRPGVHTRTPVSPPLIQSTDALWKHSMSKTTVCWVCTMWYRWHGRSP